MKLTGFDVERGNYCEGEFINYASDTARAILKEHGKGCDTYKLAEIYLARCKVIEAKEETQETEEDCIELEEEFLKDLLECYLLTLKEEFEYNTSEEAILETIRANEYDFRSDGTMD